MSGKPRPDRQTAILAAAKRRHTAILSAVAAAKDATDFEARHDALLALEALSSSAKSQHVQQDSKTLSQIVGNDPTVTFLVAMVAEWETGTVLVFKQELAIPMCYWDSRCCWERRLTIRLTQ
jgi:hypothetical protein